MRRAPRSELGGLRPLALCLFALGSSSAGCDRPVLLGALSAELDSGMGGDSGPGGDSGMGGDSGAADGGDGGATGSGWQVETSPTTKDLRGVWVSQGAGFAVGASGTILRLEGGVWTVEPPDLAMALIDYNAVWGSGNEAWAVGSTVVLASITHWDGTSWSQSYQGGRSLNAIWGSSATDVWAVGEGGTTLHYTGGSWQPLTIPLASDLNGLSGAPGDATSMRAVGSNNLYQWNGSSWQTVLSTPPGPLSGGLSVDAVGGTWVAGTGGALYGANGAWSSAQPAPTTQTLQALFRLGDLYGVGDAAVVAHGSPPGLTAASIAGTTASLRAVWGDATTGLYAVGDGGTIVHLPPR